MVIMVGILFYLWFDKMGVSFSLIQKNVLYLIYLAALPWVSWSTIRDCMHPAKYIEPKQSPLKYWYVRHFCAVLNMTFFFLHSSISPCHIKYIMILNLDYFLSDQTFSSMKLTKCIALMTFEVFSSCSLLPVLKITKNYYIFPTITSHSHSILGI